MSAVSFRAVRKVWKWLDPSFRKTLAGGFEVPILCYHQISRDGAADRSPLCVSSSEFKMQMEKCLRLGYRPLTLSRLSEALGNQDKNLRRSFVVTFDDGYEGVYENAFPILARLGLSATVFIIAESLKSANAGSYPYLKVRQIKEMMNHGIEIGSHSWSHRRLQGLSGEDLHREAVESKNLLEDTLGEPVRHFSYPFGDYSEQTEGVVKHAGYRSACSTRFGKIHRQADLYRLKRISVGQLPSAWHFLYRVQIAAAAAEAD